MPPSRNDDNYEYTDDDNILVVELQPKIGLTRASPGEDGKPSTPSLFGSEYRVTKEHRKRDLQEIQYLFDLQTAHHGEEKEGEGEKQEAEDSPCSLAHHE